MEMAKRSALIEASVHVVADCGFHGASVSVIAGRAGVAEGTVYVHFESKEHLLLEAYRELERRCLAMVMKGFPTRGSINQRFFHLANKLIRHLVLFPKEFLYADQFLSSPYRKLVSPHYLPEPELSGILQFFWEGVAQRQFKQLPPVMLLALACGPLIQVARANAAGYLYMDNERMSHAVEACWEAVALQKAPYSLRWKESAKLSRQTAAGEPPSAGNRISE